MFNGIIGSAVEGYNVKHHSVGHCLSSRNIDNLFAVLNVRFFLSEGA